MKKIFWRLKNSASLCLSGLLLATLVACGSPSIATPAEISAPTNANAFTSNGVKASAIAVPAQETQMSFQISASVKEVFVKKGDVVTAGQPLISLYSPDLEFSVGAAELEMQAADLEHQYWIPHRFERPPERHWQADAELEQTRRKVETAKALFAQTLISAPFNATVIDVNAQADEFAQAGQVVITLGDIANMQIETTDLSERDVPQIQLGQSVNIFIEALNARTTGKVIRVSPMSELVGGDVVYPVTIELNKQIAGLLWGMSAEVEIIAK